MMKIMIETKEGYLKKRGLLSSIYYDEVPIKEATIFDDRLEVLNIIQNYLVPEDTKIVYVEISEKNRISINDFKKEISKI